MKRIVVFLWLLVLVAGACAPAPTWIDNFLRSWPLATTQDLGWVVTIPVSREAWVWLRGHIPPGAPQIESAEKLIEELQNHGFQVEHRDSHRVLLSRFTNPNTCGGGALLLLVSLLGFAAACIAGGTRSGRVATA